MFKRLPFFFTPILGIPLLAFSVAEKPISGSWAKADFVHDLALLGIETRMRADVTGENPSVAKVISVDIQNRSDHDESINEAMHLGNGITTGLIRLNIAVIDDDNEGCEPARVKITPRPLLAGGPKHLLRPGDSYSVNFEVTFRCTAAKPQNRKDKTPWDYSFSATVHHDVLDGNRDADSSDDSCPRQPLQAKRGIQDRGCGRGLRNQPLGPNVVDVVLAPLERP